MLPSPQILFLALSLAAVPAIGRAQFIDDFDRPKIDPAWFTMVGDGTPTVDFIQKDGYATIVANGSTDPYNVWWTLIKRDIASSLDLAKLADPAYELRGEARVRTSHAPRRVNFMINTQRTTDFHQHLREYDLPDTTGWHTISLTTQDLDVGPGDTLFVQLCVTDYGPDKYEVDLDYFRADVVHRDQAGPDLGEPLVYHPPVPATTTFAHHLPVAHDSQIHADFPDVNFNDWHAATATGTARLLTVDPHQSPVLRWDFSQLPGRTATGAGVLELTTFCAPQGGKYIEHFGEDLGVEFGRLHVFEILGGDPAWNQETVTYHSLLQGGDPKQVFNTQMVQDVDVAPAPGGKTYVVLPRPVMQRLLDGTTKGLILRPLGAINATFYASEDATPGAAPTLHFSVAPAQTADTKPAPAN